MTVITMRGRPTFLRIIAHGRPSLSSSRDHAHVLVRQMHKPPLRDVPGLPRDVTVPALCLAQRRV